MHEVYAFGMIAPSTLIVLDDDYPPAGGYAEIAGVHPSFGGEAAGSAYVLARLGVGTKLDGTWLGNDPSSSFAIEALSDAGVDCRVIRRAAKSVTEVVVSTADARTVLGTYRQSMTDRAWNAPSEDDIRSSRIVCLDPFLGDESLQVARWCVDAGTPYVTVDASPDSEVARCAEVLIVSEEFATREFGPHEPRELLAIYVERCPGLVILTRGSAPVVHGRPGGQAQEFVPYPVVVRDTTGAGDSFRAGAIYALLNGADDEELVRTASAVAALVCEGFPGVLNSPSEMELSDFLVRRR